MDRVRGALREGRSRLSLAVLRRAAVAKRTEDRLPCRDLQEHSGQVVESDVELTGARAIATLGELPDNARIEGSVTVTPTNDGDDACLVVPPGLEVSGSLIVSQTQGNWLHAIGIGEGVCVAGDVHLPAIDALVWLPADLQVGGDLVLRDCSNLASLPAGLHVRGSLDLSRCRALESLPAGLHVGGDLLVDGCSRLKELPEDLQVDGSLSAVYVELRRVPRGVIVQGAVKMMCSAALTTVAMHVADSLDLRGCTLLAELPATLSSLRELDLSSCTEIRALPDLAELGGNLRLVGCSSLVELPASLARVGGGLDLSDCSSLEFIPEGLHVGGMMYLTGNQALAAIPQGLCVSSGLVVQRCSRLERLGSGLTVGKSVYIEDCPALVELSLDSSVGADLALFDLESLETLPERMVVRRHLKVMRCSALAEVKPGLQVGGNMTLDRCEALVLLPDPLSVNGDLGLRGCASLERLPEDLVVGGDLDLQLCSSLSTLPACVLEWPLRDNARPHGVSLGGTALPEETLDWLRDSSAAGVQFFVSLPVVSGALTHDDMADSMTLDEEVVFWLGNAGDAAARLRLDKGDESTVLQFLRRLRHSKEYGLAGTRLALKHRVADAFQLLCGDDAGVRGEVVQRMADSLHACGDKPIWALNQLCLVAEVARARGDADALRDLGRRVMRLMVVHDHVRRKIASLSWVDDVCVYLRFEIDLRESLDLPVPATDMIYRSYVAIADDELEAAKEDALAITDAQFEAWLAEWPEWQRQARLEVVQQLGQWADLPAAKPQRQSLRKRVSRRLSQLLTVTGDKTRDPVTLGADGGPIFSLGDLLRHWERTGLDLHNNPVAPAALGGLLLRVVQ